MGLCVLLEQDAALCVIGESGDEHEALQQIETLRPDIAVIDRQLPGIEGVSIHAPSEGSDRKI